MLWIGTFGTTLIVLGYSDAFALSLIVIAAAFENVAASASGPFNPTAAVIKLKPTRSAFWRMKKASGDNVAKKAFSCKGIL
jgi:hypothetical protein